MENAAPASNSSPILSAYLPVDSWNSMKRLLELKNKKVAKDFSFLFYKILVNGYVIHQSIVHQTLSDVKEGVSVLSHVPLLVTPWNAALPGSSVHGIFQARILEWVVISSSRGSSRPRDWTLVSWVSCIGRWDSLLLSLLGRPKEVKGRSKRQEVTQYRKASTIRFLGGPWRRKELKFLWNRFAQGQRVHLH